jgi:hypothetical protein
VFNQEDRQLSKMPRRANKWKRNEGEEEKKEAVAATTATGRLESLMAWVSQRIGVEGHIPHLIDVIEQDYKGFGFSILTRRAVSGALRQHPYYHLRSYQMRGCQTSGLLSANC